MQLHSYQIMDTPVVMMDCIEPASRSLLNPLAQRNSVVDGSNKSNQVDQARHAVHTTESLVQSHHFLGVGSRVIALLSITSFYSGQ